MIRQAKASIEKAIRSKQIRGVDKECAYYPCHFKGQDCTWCFCPFYPCNDASVGGKTIYHDETPIWSCMDCLFVHEHKIASKIFNNLLRCSTRKIPSSRVLHKIFGKTKRLQQSNQGKFLMIQGTASHCGKTIFTAALCRILNNRGYSVAPFKAQNMSLNSYATQNGEEIARSQAFQALAARIEPSIEMNPILIKPKGDTVSQIILNGYPFKDLKIADYYKEFALKEGLKSIKESLQRLAARYEVIIIEGAGSPAEINLKAFDIANMRIAELSDAPVILVGDIYQGGVFAHLTGTLQLLNKSQRNRIKGFIINKFLGDKSILKPAIVEIEKLTKKPVIGVVPFISNLRLPAEDSLSIEHTNKQKHAINLSVIRLPKISNFTDFEPLQEFANVNYVNSAKDLDASDAVIIPGTKNTLQDLSWLKEQGIASKILQLSGTGIPIIGICGGFQMLGRKIIDPLGLEGGAKGESEGLSLLDVTTSFDEYSKVTRRVSAQVIGDGLILSYAKNAIIEGYEIHMGKTEYSKNVKPIFKLVNPGKETIFDGAVGKKGLVFGTYLHGIFDQPPIRDALLEYLKISKKIFDNSSSKENINKIWEHDLNLLVKEIESNVNMDYVLSLLKINHPKRC